MGKIKREYIFGFCIILVFIILSTIILADSDNKIKPEKLQKIKEFKEKYNQANINWNVGAERADLVTNFRY